MRVTVLDGKAEQMLTVEGKVAEPFVAELESAWEKTRQDGGSRPTVIDLTEVTGSTGRGRRRLWQWSPRARG